MWWCFKPIVYREGDFSFIRDSLTRTSMIHDYKHVLPLLSNLYMSGFQDGERSSADSERPNVWDTPPGEEWSHIPEYAFPVHTEHSYNRNIKWLFIIKEKGWYFFVDYYKKNGTI